MTSYTTFGQRWLAGRTLFKETFHDPLLILEGCPSQSDHCLEKWKVLCHSAKNPVVIDVDGMDHVCLPVRLRFLQLLHSKDTPGGLYSAITQILAPEGVRMLSYELWIEAHNLKAKKERIAAKGHPLSPFETRSLTCNNMSIRKAAAIYGAL